MSTHIRAFAAAVEPAVARPFLIKLGVLAVLPALLLAGCRDAPTAAVVGPDPSDPNARAPRVDYRSTIAPYKSQRPVDPAPWGEQNQRVAPQPKSNQ
jgi:hypothetical protein